MGEIALRYRPSDPLPPPQKGIMEGGGAQSGEEGSGTIIGPPPPMVFLPALRCANFTSPANFGLFRPSSQTNKGIIVKLRPRFHPSAMRVLLECYGVMLVVCMLERCGAFSALLQYLHRGYYK